MKNFVLTISKYIFINILTTHCVTSQNKQANVTLITAPEERTNHSIFSSYVRPADRVVREATNASAGDRIRYSKGPRRPARRPNAKADRWKSAIGQLRSFFADRAREDAYQKTEAREHPYSLALRCELRDYGADMCSGTLVTPRWALTAAHCVADADVVAVEVFAGVTFNIFTERVPDPLPAGAQARTSREFRAHPDYDPAAVSADHDLALVAISPPFETTAFVRPAAVAAAPWRPGPLGERRCSLTAFGTVRSGRGSADDFVRKTQLLLAEKPCRCEALLRREMGAAAAGRYVCMRPAPDFGVCSGDSGGGLVCDGELAAVVSQSVRVPDMARCKRGDDEIECGGAGELSVFQDVYPALTWIQKTASLEVDDGSSARRLDSLGGFCLILLYIFVWFLF